MLGYAIVNPTYALKNLLFLIGSNQFCLSNDMPSHCFFKLSFIGLMQVRQFNIQCVELMKVPMPANGRAGAPVASFFPVIFALLRT